MKVLPIAAAIFALGSINTTVLAKKYYVTCPAPEEIKCEHFEARDGSRYFCFTGNGEWGSREFPILKPHIEQFKDLEATSYPPKDDTVRGCAYRWASEGTRRKSLIVMINHKYEDCHAQSFKDNHYICHRKSGS